MKQKLLSLSLALLSTMMAWAQYGEFISQNLKYRVTSTDSRTVELIGYEDASMLNDNLEVPAIVRDYSVTSIGEYAFEGCIALTSIKLPNSVTSIGDGAFQGSNLTSIELPNSLTSIGDEAFRDCCALQSIELPNSLTSIGEEAFGACSGLTSIEIPSSVTFIGKYAFDCCYDLTSAAIPSSVTSIGEGVFQSCYALTSIEIPSSVTSIGPFSFNGCSSLTSIEISSSVTSIGRGAFFNCPSLTSIVVADDNTVYDSRDNCHALIETQTNKLIVGCKNTVIPNSVTSIGAGAFYNIIDLTSIEIPASVTSIGNVAFQDCTSLTSIEIPSSVTSIGYSVFSGCSALENVYCHADPTQLTWEYEYDEFMPDKATKFYVEDVSAWESIFPDLNVTFVDEEELGIERITPTASTDGAWYTLSGMKLDGEPTENGIYVKDGKQVYVK